MQVGLLHVKPKHDVCYHMSSTVMSNCALAGSNRVHSSFTHKSLPLYNLSGELRRGKTECVSRGAVEVSAFLSAARSIKVSIEDKMK